MSSVEQLKQNVTATLESTGALARIRAELRAEVFAAIEMRTPSGGANIPRKLDEFARSEFGTPAIDLVVEFLQFFGLKHTLSVFKAETHRPNADVNRDTLWDTVASSRKSEFSLRKPLLVSLLEHNRRSSPALDDPHTEGRAFGAQTTTTTAEEALPQTATLYHAEPQNSSASKLITALNPGVADSAPVRRRDPQPTGTIPQPATRAAPEPVQREAAASVNPVTAVKEANSSPMTDQLHQIDDLLAQLDTKQRITDLAKAQLKGDSHHHVVEDFSDNDEVEFDDDDFEYEPDDVVKEDDSDELFPGFGSKQQQQQEVVVVVPSRPSDTVECFSDDPSAEEGALDAFDVVHEVRLLSQRTV